MNENLIDFITRELREYAEGNPKKYLLKARNQWANERVLEKCSFLTKELNNFKSIENHFEKDIYLKLVIHKIYKNISFKDKQKLDEWIVKDWGGISTHKNFETLYTSKDKKKFDRISSWSKLLSFENIHEDIIYDSRVIYSINWLIYKYNKMYNINNKYLYQPVGRNKKLSLLSVNAIIYFENSSILEEDLRGDKIYNDLFVEKDKCYNYAKCMIKQINTLLFRNINIPILSDSIQASKYPFFTEMLLFEIADKKIFDDIKNSISININK